MKPFNIASWYWCVGDDKAKFWSSAKAGFVPANDSEYLAFVARGNGPTPIDTIANLTEVFAAQYPAGMLTTYANWRQWGKATGGYLATINGALIPFATTSDSLSMISGKAQRLLQPDPPSVINWQIGPTTFTEIAAADFIVIATEIADFVQGTFDTLKTIFAEISADPPTITTIAQIDAAFAS